MLLVPSVTYTLGGFSRAGRSSIHAGKPLDPDWSNGTGRAARQVAAGYIPPRRLGGNGGCTPDIALESEAVQLFADQVLAAAPGFRLTEQNADAVAKVCRRLDGFPLALELLAPRLRSLSIETVLGLLDQRFDLLTTGNRDALPRHRTLRAVVDWSFQLLNDAESAASTSSWSNNQRRLARKFS